jgi:endoglucanase
LRGFFRFPAAVVLFMGFAVLNGKAESWSLWQAYASAFISPEGRVIDPMRGDLTTSEGQSYALFFSLVANDHPTFDKVLTWTRDNLAQGDLTEHLPGWEWGKASDGEWKLLDPHSAADSDLWISYTLIEAGRLWQTPGYTRLGKGLAERIASEEVANLPGFGPMLLPGSAGFHPDSGTWVLNPSYLPLPVVERMAGVDAAGPWAGIARDLPRFLRESSRSGFAMDWATYNQRTGFQAVAAPDGSGKFQGAGLGSYDAIRVYLWAGMTDSATGGAKSVLDGIAGMSAYLENHPVPPEKVSSDGRILSTSAPPGFSAAVIPYLDALGRKAALEKQQARLDSALDPVSKLYGHPPAYYDQNLAMFAVGWESHRFRFDRDGELQVRWKKG